MKKFSFIENLKKDYDKNPVICYYCGKPLSFKKFFNQHEVSKKFCSKKCKKIFTDINKEINISENSFSSLTEKTIYTFLTLQYPEYIICHNLKDIFPPYEIDFRISNNNIVIYIEYNGSLHCTRKKKGVFERSLQKHRINDKIKKEEICSNRQEKMIRLWSEIGLYSNPDIFENALDLLKNEIDSFIKNDYKYGICSELIVDKFKKIHKIVDKYREN